ncbi:hypothetical protein DM194_15060 (plasmid) [Azospirillum ramasamyi]|uniref:Uncharacterized protein n=2 Tax=Azospirillum ramasamyi TaxID=682998 RepID=A0A2U9SCD1_9PROT|nr:hypothetical protein DM194_15060 [Azospirillum ramasamyi]
MKQWANAHGLPLASGPMRSGGATPEGIIALAIVRNQLHGDDLERATDHLESRIHGFSRRRIRDFVNQLRSEREVGRDGEDE